MEHSGEKQKNYVIQHQYLLWHSATKSKGFVSAYQKSTRGNIHNVERFVTDRPTLKKTLKYVFQANKKMIMKEMRKIKEQPKW